MMKKTYSIPMMDLLPADELFTLTNSGEFNGDNGMIVKWGDHDSSLDIFN